jgi:hypothetical protein
MRPRSRDSILRSSPGEFSNRRVHDGRAHRRLRRGRAGVLGRSGGGHWVDSTVARAGVWLWSVAHQRATESGSAAIGGSKVYVIQPATPRAVWPDSPTLVRDKSGAAVWSAPDCISHAAHPRHAVRLILRRVDLSMSVDCCHSRKWYLTHLPQDYRKNSLSSDAPSMPETA